MYFVSRSQFTRILEDAYLLNERGQELDDPPEAILVQTFIRRKQTEHIHKVVVNSIILAGKLGEEHAAHLTDLVVVVFDTLRHLAKLALDLDLSGQNQEGESHEASALDLQALVAEARVQEVGVLVNQVVEADGHVAEGDHKVASGVGVG